MFLRTVSSEFLMKERIPCRRFINIGIRREEKNRWETRSPLTPKDAKDLMKLPDVNVFVQPCNKRIFTNKEFLEVGVKVKEDLSDCDVIVGVKEIPEDKIISGKTHICFSHTHKGQPKGVPTLMAFKNQKATLIDYELLTDEKGKRILAFGKYAGYAGMINCLHGLGDRFLQLGYRTPFLNIGLAHHYPSLAAAKKAVQAIGKEITKQGLPEELGPISFLFTGKGNVSTGAQEIFELLPQTTVTQALYERSVKDKKNAGKLISTVLQYDDFTSEGIGVFEERFLPFTKILVNGIFWDKSLPRLISKDKLGNSAVVSIADISCDINGGIEFCSHASTIDKPFFYFDPVSNLERLEPNCEKCIQMMTIDHLPAQLPRDASMYFSEILTKILKPWLKTKKVPEVIERATIVKDGIIVERFKSLEDTFTSSQQRSALVLGSGYVAKPAVEFLNKAGHQVFIASDSIEDARKIAEAHASVTPVHIDATNKTKLSKLIETSDAVVSLLPASMHTDVAKLCIIHKKNMVTGSYISPAMRALDEQATSSNITILNEIGLDPGLDHLSAMKLIDEVKSQGDTVASFVSWCGGLPAPECADNPFGYKFSWRPQGVLLASQNPAKYMLQRKIIEIEGKNLLRSAMPIKIHPAFAFEGIPNRDSLGYISQYGLEGVQTMFRGTLRYRGFSELVDGCARIGLLSQEPIGEFAALDNWQSVINELVPNTGSSTIESFALALGSASLNLKAKKLLDALEWLGVMSKSELFEPGKTMLDSFANLLERKLAYRAGERDMAFMFHELQVKSGSGKMSKLTSTLIEYGDPNGYSAMARTVGVPVAVAADLMIRDQIKEKGVIAPLSKAIYEPMLSTLSKCGISFKETRDFSLDINSVNQESKKAR